MVRIVIATLLALSFAVPAISIDGLLLCCAYGDMAAMQPSECCCVRNTAAPECDLVAASEQCCEIRADFDPVGCDEAVAGRSVKIPFLLVGSDLQHYTPVFRQVSHPRDQTRSALNHPLPTYLLNRSLLI